MICIPINVIISRADPSTASDVRGMFANVMTSLEEMQQHMAKVIDRVEERAQQGYERLRDDLAETKPHAKCDQVQLIQNTDQCLAESLALAT